MSGAQQGDTVRVHYTGKLEDGSVFDSSVQRDPLEFTIGEGQIIPGFEKAVVGMEAGQNKTIQVESGDGYGPRHEEMVQVVERSQIPDNITLEVGAQLQANHPEGGPIILTVTELTEIEVTLDANHPLAGKDLTFEIELIGIG
jgi:peptidylprolyl isomerase